MRIFFIGYMGAGKSHTAKQLEEVTGRKCIDLDVAIEEQMGFSIEAAFAQRGEVFFRNQEALVLDKVLSDSTIEIVACGGGTSCAEGAGALLTRAGHVVHLDPPFEVLIPRLRSNPTRPLLMRSGAVLTELEIKAHWEGRKSCYAFAHERLVHPASHRDIQRWKALFD